MKKSLLLLVLISFSLMVNAQSKQIKVFTKNNFTNEMVGFVNVYVKGKKSDFSNIKGKIELNTSKLKPNDRIGFHKKGYQRKTIPFSKLKDLDTILLEPLVQVEYVDADGRNDETYAENYSPKKLKNSNRNTVSKYVVKSEENILHEQKLKEQEEEYKRLRKAYEEEERLDREKQLEEQREQEELEEIRRIKIIREKEEAERVRRQQIEEESRLAELAASKQKIEAEKRKLAQIEKERKERELLAQKEAAERERKRLDEIEDQKKLAALREEKRLQEVAERRRLAELAAAKQKVEEEKRKLAQIEKERKERELLAQKEAAERERKRLDEIEDQKKLADLREEKRLQEAAERKRLAELAKQKKLEEEAKLAEEEKEEEILPIIDFFKSKLTFDEVGTTPLPLTHMGYTNSKEMYIWGGQNSSGFVHNKIYKYDENAKKWETLHSEAEPIKFNSVIQISPKELMSVGGSKSISIYNISKSKIDQKELFPSVISNPSLTQDEENVYVLGGSANKQFSNKFYAIDKKSKRLTKMPNLPFKTKGKAINYNGSIYLFGGRGEKLSRTVYKFDLTKKIWEEYDKFPIVPLDYSFTQYKNYVFLIGKMNQLDYLVIYDLESKSAHGYSINIPNRYAGATIKNKTLYIYGGHKTNYSNISNVIFSTPIQPLIDTLLNDK